MPISPGFADRRAKQFDKALEVRDGTLPALTGSAVENPIVVPGLTKQHNFCASVGFENYTGWTAGSAEWIVAIEAAATINSTFVEVGRVVLNGDPLKGATKTTEIALSGLAIESLVPGAQAVRARAIKVGGAGSLKYSAFLAS